MKHILRVVFGIVLALQLSNIGAAQKKEDPNLTPIVISVDAQRKEDPNSRPITVGIDAQKKEDPNARPSGLIERIHAWFFR